MMMKMNRWSHDFSCDTSVFISGDLMLPFCQKIYRCLQMMCHLMCMVGVLSWWRWIDDHMTYHVMEECVGVRWSNAACISENLQGSSNDVSFEVQGGSMMLKMNRWSHDLSCDGGVCWCRVIQCCLYIWKSTGVFKWCVIWSAGWEYDVEDEQLITWLLMWCECVWESGTLMLFKWCVIWSAGWECDVEDEQLITWLLMWCECVLESGTPMFFKWCVIWSAGWECDGEDK